MRLLPTYLGVFNRPLKMTIRTLISSQENSHLEIVLHYPHLSSPHFHRLSFRTFPVPMRRDVEDITILPPWLIIIIDVLRETAHIHDPKMRIDIWPLVRSRFAAVIETGPHKSSHHPRIFCGERPPILGTICPPRERNILIRHVTIDCIFVINSASCYGASHFSPTIGWSGWSMWYGTIPLTR